jgi:hypothetical protein
MFVGSIVLMITERNDLEAQEPSSGIAGEGERNGEDKREEDGGIGGINKSGWPFVKGKSGMSYGTRT